MEAVRTLKNLINTPQKYRAANDEKGPNEVLFWLIIDSFVDVIFIADIGKLYSCV